MLLIVMMKTIMIIRFFLRELWGYSKEESLASDDLHKVIVVMIYDDNNGAGDDDHLTFD